MKDYKEMDKLVFEFGDDIKYFAKNHGGTMPPAIKTQLQDLMFTSFAKEIDAITEREELEIKYKKKFYNKLLHAKLKLAKRDRADAWFDKVFQKYFNRGILEHLLVYGVRFLYNKDLFVPKRLFVEINNDALLAQFTAAACEYFGWSIQTEPVDEPITDEEPTTDNEQQTQETTATADDTKQSDEPAACEQQPNEPQEQTEGMEQATEEQETVDDDAADEDTEAATSLISEKKSSYWDGRRKGKK